MSVLDCDDSSPTYGEVVGWTELPTAGNELHHFGWNACSSALCHEGHNGALERRYLIVPGIRSSRTYVLDTKPDPRQPEVIRTIEAEELAAKAGYSRPHTVHCGPGGIFMSNLGGADAEGPGGVALIDHDTFEVTGAWETDRGEQQLRLRRLVAPERRRRRHLGVGDPVDDRERAQPRGPPGEAVRPPPQLLEPLRGQAVPADRPGRRASDGARAEAGSPSRAGLGPGRGRDQRRGPLGLGVAVVPRRRQVGRQEGDHHPGRAGRRVRAAARPSALRRGSAPGQRHRPVRR